MRGQPVRRANRAKAIIAPLMLAAKDMSSSHAPESTNTAPEVDKTIPDKMPTRLPHSPAANRTVAATVTIATKKLASRAENSDMPSARYEAAVSQNCSGGLPQKGTRSP